jgi:transcriptional regulator with XRE-family HTH domain
MSYKSEDLIQEIRERRTDVGVSQRSLSTRSGLTQAHISQIETGSLEPGLSSFIDMARALDLELVLVPKKLLPAVQGIIRQTPAQQFSPESGAAALSEITRGERMVVKQKQLHGSSADLDRIADYLRFLRHAPLRKSDLQIVSNAVKKLRRYQAGPQSRDIVASIAADLQQLRNRVAHGPSEAPRPAYAIDDDEHNDA